MSFAVIFWPGWGAVSDLSLMFEVRNLNMICEDLSQKFKLSQKQHLTPDTWGETFGFWTFDKSGCTVYFTLSFEFFFWKWHSHLLLDLNYVYKSSWLKDALMGQ